MTSEQQKEQLKFQRRNKKGSLTRALNILKAAVDEKGEREVIEEAVKKVNEALGGIEEIHGKLVDVIIDEAEFDTEENYMQDCQMKQMQGIQMARKYLTEVIKEDKTSADNTSEAENQDIQAVARIMAKRDVVANGLTEFDDNPVNYRTWKATFKAVTKDLGLSEREEADLLMKWLGTNSSKVVMRLRAVHSHDHKAGLKALWERLDNEYGAPELIESILLNKLENFAKIGQKDNQKLRELADLLSEIQVAKGDERLPGLAFFDTAKGVNIAVEKLPYYIQDSWRNTGSKYKEEKKVSFPPFKVFVDFINRQAKMRNDPSFRTAHQGSTQQKNSSSTRSFRTGTNNSFKPKQEGCVQCGEDHLVIACDQFKALKLTDRETLIKEKGLCRGCLKRGHIWRFCKNKQTCEVCQRHHPTILHRHDKSAEVKPTDSTHSRCSNMTSEMEGDAQCVSPILPVWVNFGHKRVLTYALLDDQSDACFMSHALKRKLGASGTEINLEISTILTQGTVKSEKISGITIQGLNQDEMISLPTTYTRDCIPATPLQIPTPEKIMGWPHLKELSEVLSPYLDMEVGLLIGATCPRALIPQDVKPGMRNGDPYAVRTPLGWGVVGDLKRGSDASDDTRKKHFAFRSSTKEVIKVLERDFIDVQTKDKMISREDKKFLRVMEEGMEMVNGHVQLPLPFKTDDPKLPNNKGVAMKRLLQLKTKFLNKPKFADQYKTFMERIGDIVLLCEEGVPRNRWKMCKVVKVYPSDDGLIRKVSVFIGRRKSTLDRPITKLVLPIPVVKD
ncbi:hypothetical protein HOLleu_16824 [Holothuria leucospilota]|uniref:DUF5641 domain-containing protein n=1 Tax=Holothuria leucospilota TaxID=206669 RepID=A0A9Q1C6C7_HOLLE|nr:hypothetical protein HOLleu_16824 [Holothuria leucospilota]